jgi:hypothetical protein
MAKASLVIFSAEQQFFSTLLCSGKMNGCDLCTRWKVEELDFGRSSFFLTPIVLFRRQRRIKSNRLCVCTNVSKSLLLLIHKGFEENENLQLLQITKS